MTTELKNKPAEKSSTDALKKWRRRAVLAGMLLALLCRALPVDYQTPCELLAQLCTGGVLP